jgi:acyl carrier protein
MTFGNRVTSMFSSDKVLLLLAASKCGLFSQDAASASSCNLSFSHKEYVIRLARLDDAAALALLDASCWSVHMRADLHEIERRLRAHAAACLVAIVKGDQIGAPERIIGALYMQRISSVDALRSTRFPSDRCADSRGTVLHFFSIAVLSAFQHFQLGIHLRDFAKQLALCEGIIRAVATTRCSNFDSLNNASADSYLRYALGGNDPTLQFHMSGGAKVTGIIPHYRPEDHENLGHAVLAEYCFSLSESELQDSRDSSGMSRTIRDRKDVFNAIVDELSSILGRPVSHNQAHDSPFMDLGLDSLGVIIFCNRICSRFDLKLYPTDMFNHPNVRSLVSFICQSSARTKSVTSNRKPMHREPVAVVSIHCVFPGGCDSVEDFWLGLCSGRDFTSDAPASWNSDTKKLRAGFLQAAQRCHFDPEYFGLSLSEIQSMCVYSCLVQGFCLIRFNAGTLINGFCSKQR